MVNCRPRFEASHSTHQVLFQNRALQVAADPLLSGQFKGTHARSHWLADTRCPMWASQVLGPSPAFYALWPAGQLPPPWNDLADAMYAEVIRSFSAKFWLFPIAKSTLVIQSRWSAVIQPAASEQQPTINVRKQFACAAFRLPELRFEAHDDWPVVS